MNLTCDELTGDEFIGDESIQMPNPVCIYIVDICFVNTF